MSKYTVAGSVRGTILTTDSAYAALSALREDGAGCQSQGGYSDCRVSLTDGGQIMDDEEYAAALDAEMQRLDDAFEDQNGY